MKGLVASDGGRPETWAPCSPPFKSGPGVTDEVRGALFHLSPIITSYYMDTGQSHLKTVYYGIIYQYTCNKSLRWTYSKTN